MLEQVPDVEAAVDDCQCKGGKPQVVVAGVPAGLVISSKSTPTDLVSEADLEAERLIRSILRDRVPEDGIVGEEGDDVASRSGRRWLVDPIDGTVNFLFGHPQWCVSVACEGVAGVVYDPMRDELFAGGADLPTTLDGRPVTPVLDRTLAEAMVATGFGYDAQQRGEQGALVADIVSRCRDIRRAGSAALDLAWAAAGRVDAYFEHGVKPWDIAAGVLLLASPVLAHSPHKAGRVATASASDVLANQETT